MARKKIDTKLNSLWGWTCIAIGLYPILTAAGWFPIDPLSIHVPMWGLALCGLMFVASGCMILVGRKSRMNDLFAFVFCLSAATVGFWISFYGDSGQVSGGIPFVSQEFNDRLARIVFGTGATLSLGISMIALQRFRKSRKRRSPKSGVR